MSQQIPDPARWLADLMKAQHTVLWPTGDIFDTSETLAAAATSWTKAVADLTENGVADRAFPYRAAQLEHPKHVVARHVGRQDRG